ncbi:sporulation protein YqfD [Bacillus dakarensis]|uniref:sporulation protein YqfD n=1 Tax=Robertmurraya dakarensis TaxID=1926278 RepID=UPI0009818837|nr:sporulation protein YqfD [Bacillus dakarensis]
MRNQWIHLYSGYVTVKVSGKGLERFINALTRSDILIWNVKRHGTAAVTFQISLEDIHNLRHEARNSDCKIEFLARTGLPFLMKRLLKNSGFLIGGGTFLVIVFLLSNMIWGIEIKGADPATEYEIRKQLDEIGVKKGKLQFLVDDPESIQRKITNGVSSITWIGVEVQGTTYHLQVVEKNEPEKPEQFGPQNLLATKKAVIVDMFVEEGQPVVSVNDHVKPGQLLVSGQIGKEGEEKSVSAKGEIFGETWYKSQVVLPLKSNFKVFNGNEEEKHFIKVGDMSIPIWGFGKVSYPDFEKEKNEKQFKFLKWKLPIHYVHDTYRESEDITRVYTKEEAIDVAKEMARKDIKNLLPEDATIKGENVLHHRIQNGKVYLSMHFQVIENIAKAYPIIQGESE